MSKKMLHNYKKTLGVRGKDQPKNKEELQALCRDESVYLGDIDTSLITDMSELFRGLALFGANFMAEEILGG